VLSEIQPLGKKKAWIQGGVFPHPAPSVNLEGSVSNTKEKEGEKKKKKRKKEKFYSQLLEQKGHRSVSTFVLGKRRRSR